MYVYINVCEVETDIVIPAQLVMNRELGLVEFVEQLELYLGARYLLQFAFLEAQLDMAVGEAGVKRSNALVVSVSKCVGCNHRGGVRDKVTHRHLDRLY